MLYGPDELQVQSQWAEETWNGATLTEWGEALILPFPTWTFVVDYVYLTPTGNWRATIEIDDDTGAFFLARRTFTWTSGFIYNHLGFINTGWTITTTPPFSHVSGIMPVNFTPRLYSDF